MRRPPNAMRAAQLTDHSRQCPGGEPHEIKQRFVGTLRHVCNCAQVAMSLGTAPGLLKVRVAIEQERRPRVPTELSRVGLQIARG